MTPRAALDHGLGELALTLPPGAREQLLEYIELLAKWNRTYNLTAIRDPLAMVSHHLLDSLVVLPHLPMPAAQPSLADAGSGAGACSACGAGAAAAPSRLAGYSAIVRSRP